MENLKATKKFVILLMGKYRNFFIRGAFPSLIKRKKEEYKKIIYYNYSIIELTILNIDEYSIEEKKNAENYLYNNLERD